MPKSSRQIALEILSQTEREGILGENGLARLNALAGDPKERSLAAELVRGTLRWQGRIDYLLSQLSRRPLASLPVFLRNILRLGAYQILFLHRVPHWAAVDESAKLARRYGHQGQVKYVNGVLRNLIRTGDQIPFPDPAQVVSHLAVTHAFPEWLASRWIKRFGAAEAARLMAACNIP
ncbi:MAG: transcription antitermination factor NusB, partial [bacterium]|nr:transcription antitermination factor NusB [bacterium]